MLLDLALGLAVGGDCLADIVLRAEPRVFGLVASDPTVSRTIDRLARDATTALAAIDTARAAARAKAWELAGDHAPNHGVAPEPPLIIDVTRHRRRARAEDRIRAAKDTGLTNLPLHELDQNRIWQAIVALAARSPPGPRCSPSPNTRPGGGSPNGCG